MADFSAIKFYLEEEKLNSFSFYPKNEKPFKTIILHIPIDTPAEDISNGLVALGFDKCQTNDEHSYIT
jgi:hypothetical protein